MSVNTSNAEMAWYELPLVDTLPLPHRVYAWWVKRGLKRANGLSLGGNKFFSFVRLIYRLSPSNEDNFATIPAYDGKFSITVDLTDFEVPHHTLPLLSGTDTEARALELLLPRGGTFVDVGANHGFYSLLASVVGGPDATVLAFEPQPRLIAAMQNSKAINKFDQLRIHQLALGAAQGDVEFFTPNTGSGIASMYREHAEQHASCKRSRVSMDTLDAVCGRSDLQRLDLLKIDVEGFEVDVLRGAERTITKHKPLIWYEFNPAAQRTARHTQHDIQSLLRSFGYDTRCDMNDVASGVLRNLESIDNLTNVLAIPKGREGEVRSRIRPRIDNR